MMIGDKKNNRNKVSNAYDAENSEKEQLKNTSDENKDQAKNSADADKTYEVEPLPESFRPRKDGPGGN